MPMLDPTFKAIAASTAVSEAFLVQIGRITVQFALLERDLIELTHHLLGAPEAITRCVTSELSFRGITQLAASLLRTHHPEELETFRLLLKDVAQCEERRNAITHSRYGSWCNEVGEDVVIRTKYSAKQTKGLSLQRELMTVGDLATIADEIAIATFEVEAFRRRIGSTSP